MLISGEPGIGKTPLSQAFAAVCRTRHARVACGHALECEGGRLYAPWTQGIGRLANGQATRNVKALLGPPAKPQSGDPRNCEGGLYPRQVPR